MEDREDYVAGQGLDPAPALLEEALARGMGRDEGDLPLWEGATLPAPDLVGQARGAEGPIPRSCGCPRGWARIGQGIEVLDYAGRGYPRDLVLSGLSAVEDNHLFHIFSL